MTIGLILGAYQRVTRGPDGHSVTFVAIVQPKGDGQPIPVEVTASVPESVPVGIQAVKNWAGLYLCGATLERKEAPDGTWERFNVRVSPSPTGDSESSLEAPAWQVSPAKRQTAKTA